MNPYIRLPFGKGRLVWTPDLGEAFRDGRLMFNGHLWLTHHREGELIEARDLGSGLVTNAGVEYMATDFAGGAADISNFEHHDSGTGATAAAVGDTALQTPTGISREAGTPTNPSANVYHTEATITYDDGYALREWGLFSAATTGVLWDRRVFDVLNVVDQDEVTFKYSLTIQAGG